MKMMRTKNAELRFDEENRLLYIRMLEGAELDLTNTIEHYNAIREITTNEKYLALIDAKEYFTMTTDALEYAARPDIIGQRIAAAHYSPAPANRITTNFFRKSYKPDLPIEVFDSKEEAIEWLMKQNASGTGFGHN